MDARKIEPMARRRALAAAMLGALLSACTSMQAHTGDDFIRGNAAAEQFYKDSRACEKQAEAHGKEYGFGPYDPTHGAYNRMFDACMRSAGYESKPPPP